MKRNATLLQTLKPLLAALLIAFPPAQAQVTGVPGAGSILQQIEPVMRAAPTPVNTGLAVEKPAAGKLPAGTPFPVTTIRITGNKKIPTETLHALVADGEGKNLTLPQLGELADRITAYYQRQGYPLAQAVIPAQTIQGGIVTIQIIVARYGQISLDNRSGVNDALLKATLAPLQSEQEVEQKGLDRTLLLLSDLPGAAISAILKPGQVDGTSDLVISATTTPPVAGNVALDGYGNRYTGRARLGGTVSINDPLNLKSSSTLSLSVLTAGNGMNYGSIAYQVVVNGEGTRIGGTYSGLKYALNGALAPLNAHGTAQVATAWVKQPLLRSRDVNVYAQLEYTHLKLSDHIDISALQIDRHLESITAAFSGDMRDTLLLGGANAWNMSYAAGRVGFDNAAAALADAASAKTQGRFSKWNASLSRLQGVGPRSNVYLALSGQWANTNLDSSQKMTAGGPSTVRAYDTGAVSGDSGYLATAEFRYDLGSVWNGQWQAVAFVDSAHVMVNKNIFGTGVNSANLSGAGLGLNWMGTNRLTARAYAAAPIGATPVLVGTTNAARAWVEVGSAF